MRALLIAQWFLCGLGVAGDLALPPVSEGAPAAGKRVSVTTPEYAGTGVHHMVFLPPDWKADAGKRWPVIVEYTGNRFPASGSTGEIKDAGLGFGISGGEFIWVTLPFVAEDGMANAVTWWGDEKATVAYAIKNVPRICKEFGGDPGKVLICGFSRGAIAVNYIGLHDDEIAKLWCGFITHDHYDGVRHWGKKWGSPLEAYREAALVRLRRLGGRPVLVCQNPRTKETAEYLRDRVPLEGFTFLDVDTKRILGDFPNKIAIHPHTDRWPLRESPERRKLREWLAEALEGAK